ncbi:YeeE/YedE thiosulfate transporter family protein [Gynuella sunshinyii]|uniref:Rhodanese-related sulfurtransferase n=1 Tax=Gynuella sunshinyii YC6258 TaxID=1445510 RepID=A0A0C5VRU2_9GAMM|nr:YeeE/YedE thiosulfate transporter family protein [Gynuella sunshinyii]AJQ92989.1 rhodanese-related sulfurtransferase [Gynuella sunshinyii YC6258]
MTVFPLNLVAEYGAGVAYLIYILLGFGFGFVLESAGFGNSRKLAAQFYFKELTVFKVMFTAIIVAMVLIFLATALGWLDYRLIWVNPTYLWPGILGGLIMGAGFIIGGFCPGTSLVALATLKLDGLFFVLGVLFGIFVFGETVDFYNVFFNSSYMGRFTLPELFHLGYGSVVLIIVVVALLLLWGSEWVESRVSGITMPRLNWRAIVAGVLVLLAGITAAIGQPDFQRRWNSMAAAEQPRIDQRQIYASPLEVLHLQNDRQIVVRLLDIRSQSDFNYFHIRDAQRANPNELEKLAQALIAEPANTVFILVGNDEQLATEVWKQLRGASVPSLYVLEGGINLWIEQFADDDFLREARVDRIRSDQLGFRFVQALGDQYPMASPNPEIYEQTFDAKVKLELKRAPTGGGCG